MIHGREVGAQGHVVEISIGLGCGQRCIHQFLVSARQRDVPGGELVLEGAELSARQRVTKAARAAVRQETDTALTQAEHLSRATGAVIVREVHHFTFAKMVAAAIRTELADLFEKVGELIGTQPVKPQHERVLRPVMTDMRGVFATLCPFDWDPKCVQHLCRCTLCGGLHAEGLADLAGLAHGTLTTTRTGGRAFENRVNQRPADGLIPHLIGWQVELQEAH